MTYLQKILAHHRDLAKADGRSVDDLLDRTRSLPPCRGFGRSLASTDGLAVISEVKRRSPSKGDLKPDLDPGLLARAYEEGGASCLSVLTDEDFFGGSVADLVAARDGVDLPVLRKDFTVSAHDVLDARLMGADAVLLIVAALDQAELVDYYDLATEIGLDVLVETHDEAEVERALALNPSVVGVNQRDLVTFEVDTARAARLAATMPPGVVAVAESGIQGPGDIAELWKAGFKAVLVGESLVRSGDPAGAVAALRSVVSERE